MTKSIRVILLALSIAGLANAPACSGSSQSSGSKSNWLEPCEADGDCGQGSCLCGLCTTTCFATSGCELSGGVCQPADAAVFDGKCGDDAGASVGRFCAPEARSTGTLRQAAEGFARQLGALSCDYLAGCLSDHSRGISSLIRSLYAADALRAPGACRTEMGEFFADNLAPIGRAIDSGTVGFDASAAEACLAEARATCYPPFAWAIREGADDIWMLCPEAFTGTVSRGGACTIHEQCSEDSYCAAGEAICPGACAPRLAPGSVCDADPQACGGELPHCGGSGDFLVCVEQLVDPTLATLGQPCDLVETTGTKERWRSCEEGLACVAGTCVTPIARGGLCDSESLCTPGLRCAEGTCAELPRYEVGAPCPWTVCGAFPLLVCVDGSCAEPGSGDLCLSGSSCAAGTECVDERCRPVLGVDEDCFQNEQCGSGLCYNRPLPGGGIEGQARCCGG